MIVNKRRRYFKLDNDGFIKSHDDNGDTAVKDIPMDDNTNVTMIGVMILLE